MENIQKAKTINYYLSKKLLFTTSARKTIRVEECGAFGYSNTFYDGGDTAIVVVILVK